MGIYQVHKIFILVNQSWPQGKIFFKWSQNFCWTTVSGLSMVSTLNIQVGSLKKPPYFSYENPNFWSSLTLWDCSRSPLFLHNYSWHKHNLIQHSFEQTMTWLKWMIVWVNPFYICFSVFHVGISCVCSRLSTTTCSDDTEFTEWWCPVRQELRVGRLKGNWMWACLIKYHIKVSNSTA